MEKDINIIVKYFAWWNKAMRSEDQLTADNFRRFFAEDGALIVNSNLRATGPEELVPHYWKILSSVDDVQMVLPVEYEFTTPENALVHCYTYVVRDGEELREEAMAYAQTSGNKISRLIVVAAK